MRSLYPPGKETDPLPVTLAITGAKICIDCDCLTNAEGPLCPHCGQDSLHPLTWWLTPLALAQAHEGRRWRTQGSRLPNS